VVIIEWILIIVITAINAMKIIAMIRASLPVDVRFMITIKFRRNRA